MSAAIARILGLLIAVALAGCATTERQAPSQDEREVQSLDRGWRFSPGDAGEGASAPDFDDSRWQTVSLPHSWNRLGEYRLERSEDTAKVQGVGWYRLHLADVRRPKRRQLLQFDGVGNVARVWVNGVEIGSHSGAFSRFRFDITDALRAGGNVIAVRADNSKPAPGSATEHVIPLLGDFFIHGGLYRGVSLISLPEIQIDPLDHGGPGVYARTLKVDAATAEIAVLARLRNAARRPRSATVQVALRDREGRVVAQTAKPIELAPGPTSLEQRLTLASPRLWDGRADPYLYTVAVTVSDGVEADRVVQPLGIRSFHVDPERGFFLNGRQLPLQGVSRHQDWLGKGWALSREDHARDMALIREMGANTVRLAHYQHAEEWFEEADRAGMIVWAELPFVNKVSFGDRPASPELVANARAQLVELIRQNFNHPSVVTWGIGNEVDIDLAFGRLGPKADARPLLRELHQLSRAEDPDRPTVIADCCEDTPGKKIDGLPVLAGLSDLIGYNRYFGWYYGTVRDLGPHLDALHAKHPTIPISVSEYGAGGALTQHSDNPEGGPIDTSGRPHPEEFQSWWHEQSWPQLASRRYLWANWIWNMFDFSSTVRQEGDATDINDKGLVSFDRKLRKDAFFYYKANWSDEPFVHITGRRYVERAFPVNDIRVYSNAPAVEATLGGRRLGRAPCRGGICLFEQLAMPPGTAEIVVRSSIDPSVTDAVRWSIPDAGAGLRINVGDLAGFVAADGVRVGSDNWFIGGTAKRIGGKRAEGLGEGDRRYRSGYREGAFGYSIPLPNGRWRVTVMALEPDERRGSRRFDVLAEGRRMLAGFDPGRAAGGPLIMVARSFTAEVEDKRLDLGFTGEAVLSGLVIAPAAGSR